MKNPWLLFLIDVSHAARYFRHCCVPGVHVGMPAR